MRPRQTLSTLLSTTHLEEDLRYLPLMTNTLEMRWQSVEILGKRMTTPMRLTLGAPTAWETLAPDGSLELNRPGILSGRPDKPSIPRIPPLLPGTGTRWGFATYSGPVILRDMDVVITMPLDVSPQLGVRREILQFIPTLQQELRRVPKDYGYVAHLRLGRPGRERQLFIIFDRADEYDRGDIEAWSAGMRIVLQMSHGQGIQQLMVMRPPATKDLITWNDVFHETEKQGKLRPANVIFMRGQCQVDVRNSENNNDKIITLPDNRIVIDEGLL